MRVRLRAGASVRVAATVAANKFGRPTYAEQATMPRQDHQPQQHQIIRYQRNWVRTLWPSPAAMTA